MTNFDHIHRVGVDVVTRPTPLDRSLRIRSDLFESIQRVFLPELIKWKDPMRVYSAGASDGREIYSIAMLLAESGILEQSHLLGVDCRSEAIRAAEKGLFPRRVLAELDASRHRFLEEAGDQVSVRREIRNAIRWRVADVLTFDTGVLWDMILCRHLTIYLNPAEAVQAASHLVQPLAPGGFLITGKAERPPLRVGLERLAPSIYR